MIVLIQNKEDLDFIWSESHLKRSSVWPQSQLNNFSLVQSPPTSPAQPHLCTKGETQALQGRCLLISGWLLPVSPVSGGNGQELPSWYLAPPLHTLLGPSLEAYPPGGTQRSITCWSPRAGRRDVPKLGMSQEELYFNLWYLERCVHYHFPGVVMLYILW